jgi:general secretion pathway protein G
MLLVALQTNCYTLLALKGSLIMKNHAFTLIELLIVVAIIGILAAIAVPNFMNAQIRAKLAGTQADFVNLATVFEAYFTDYQTYPSVGTANNIHGYHRYAVLTSPIAYTSSIYSMAHERFYTDRDKGLNGGPVPQEYYEVCWGRADKQGTNGTNPDPNVFRNNWWVESIGPNRRDESTASNNYPKQLNIIVYNPTNGLVSKGDMFRAGGAFVPRWAEKFVAGSYGSQ